MSVVSDSRPVFSVIIPTFNHGEFIAEAVASVLKQDFESLEILVVDDGSTDNTQERVPRGDRRLRYIYQDNRGLSAARNRGIRDSRGLNIALLDADDLYLPGFLSSIHAVLSNGADAAYCGFQCVDAKTNRLPFSGSKIVRPEDLFEELLNGNFLVPACMVASRECYQAMGPFDESLRACEDWDMWLRFANGFRVVGMEKELVLYRIVPQSMSSDPEHMLKYRLAVLDKHVNDECKCSQGRPYAEAYLRTAVEHLQLGNFEAALRCFGRMSTLCPKLLRDDRIFYELACGRQPRGRSGDFRNLDLSLADETLSTLLDELFEGEPRKYDADVRSRALSNAHLALSRLAYGCRKLELSRYHLLRSCRKDVRILLRFQFWIILFRSLLKPLHKHESD